MREFGRQLTAEQVAIAETTARQPFNEPTELVSVPTAEEMSVWFPDEAPERMRWKKEVNIVTGQVTCTELSLEEYRTRHVAKIVANNNYVLRKQAELRAARRQKLLEDFIDTLDKP